MVNATIKTFECGKGDCIFFLLKKEDVSEPFSIMIDCGKFIPEVREFMAKELGNHINIMIATHIDNDHISGLATMLREIEDLKIDRIYYNCFQEFDTHDCEDKQKIDEKVAMLYPSIQASAKKSETKINSTDACLLCVEIGKKDSLRKNWEAKQITKDYGKIELGDDYGTITFLTPTTENLSELKEKCMREFNRYTHIVLNDENFKNQQKYYEAIQLYLQARTKHFDSISIKAQSDMVTALSMKKAKTFKPSAMTIENACSIAFEWECRDRRVLFLGDSDPDEVAESIREKFGKEVRYYAAIKMSHHGSQHSTSENLLDVIDSDCFLYTGGNNTDRPSLESIAKVVMRPLPNNITIRNIYCNRVSNPIVKQLSDNVVSELKQNFKFSFGKNDTVEFTY